MSSPPDAFAAGRIERSEPGPGGIEMFLLSVLFMTGWVLAVVTGFAGNFAHLLGLASVATIVFRNDRRHLNVTPKDVHHAATI